MPSSILGDVNRSLGVIGSMRKAFLSTCTSFRGIAQTFGTGDLSRTGGRKFFTCSGDWNGNRSLGFKSLTKSSHMTKWPEMSNTKKYLSIGALVRTSTLMTLQLRSG